MRHLLATLNDCQTERDVLSHALADKKAELQIEINKGLGFQQELEKSQANEKKLASFVSQFQSSAHNLQEISGKTESFIGCISSKMDEAFRKLAVFSQRISFASGRIQFFQGQRLM